MRAGAEGDPSRGAGFRLETYLCAELHRARIANASNLAECRARDIQAGEAPEVRVVDDIEDFSPQLEPKAFTETDGLGQGEIKARCRRSLDHTSPPGAGRVWQTSRRIERIGLETGGVKPLLSGVRRILIRVAQKIGPGHGVGKDQSETRVIKT